jgi:hypothetical protein
MYFSFSLLRIKGLYMFRALLANPKEALHKRHFVYCVRAMSVGYTRIGVELQSVPETSDNINTLTRLSAQECFIEVNNWFWSFRGDRIL